MLVDTNLETLSQDLLNRARKAGVMISTAESCTGGMLAAAITSVPGSSDIFGQSVVTYSNEAKTKLLGVMPLYLVAFGAVSEQVASDMAKGALRSSGADIAISVTGIAGPGGSDRKPEGRVCFGLAKGNQTRTETVDFGALGREEVRRSATKKALELLIWACS